MTAPDPSGGSALWGVGTVVGGRYRLVGPIGAGAMGEVWRADHVTLGTSLAVKVIDTAARGDQKESLSRFLQEARAAAMLQSSNVVHIVDHGHDGRIAYIAMELLEGESLASRIAKHRTLAPALVARVVHEMARALTKAHAMGIVHRDLKPENVFLAQVEGREVTKILDFGIAKILTAAPGSYHQTNANTIVGTPVYMSPEQVLGNRTVDSRSDLWQVAMIAFECLTGEVPFNADGLGALYLQICSAPLPVPSTRASSPRGFDAWFERAASRDPNARYQTARELAEALAIALDVSALDLEAVSGTAWARPDGVLARTGATAPLETAPARAPDRRAFTIGALASATITMIVITAGVVLLRPRHGPGADGVAKAPSVTVIAAPPDTSPPEPAVAPSALPSASAPPAISAPASTSSASKPPQKQHAPGAHPAGKRDDDLGI